MIYHLILFILVSYGLTAIGVDGKILDPVRPKWQLFKCFQCLGFWIGSIIATVLWYFCGIKFLPNVVVNIIAMGFLSSGTSYILGTLFDDEGIRFKRN